MANTMGLPAGSAIPNRTARAPAAQPAVTAGQAQANQLAGSGGSNADYMAARGAKPVNSLGTAVSTTADSPAQPAQRMTPTAAPAPTPSPTPAPAPGAESSPAQPAQFSHLNAPAGYQGQQGAGGSMMVPPANDLGPMPSIISDPNGYIAWQKKKDAQTQGSAAPGTADSPAAPATPATPTPAPAPTNGAPTNGGGANPAQWADQLKLIMGQKNLPPEIQAALQQAHDHFAGAAPAPGPAPANSAHANAPGRGDNPPRGQRGRDMATPPAAGKPFKGRTTSMQRRGVGVGQPAPVTPTAAAQNFVQKMPAVNATKTPMPTPQVA